MDNNDDLLLVLSTNLFDIQKGKGNRDGLIQQVVTYVRDGHTITRKQWVRSGFADHAKKNEEEKKKTLLNNKERANKKHERQIQENNEKQETKDRTSRSKLDRRIEEQDPTHHGRQHKLTKEKIEEYKKVMEEKKKRRGKEDNKKEDDKKHDRYGQSDQTKKDNKEEQNTLQKPITESAKPKKSRRDE